jgi:2-methylcitrate dehydratase PrpD
MDAPPVEPYRTALLDWLACAAGGLDQPATRAAATGDGLLERVTRAGCAGHVLDFDDTLAPGLVHASAPVAPVALLLGAELGCDVGTVLTAFAAGFEATAALARAGHPALYERGWHPTAVCGSAGAAIAAASLYGLSRERTDTAVGLALLRSGGLRAAFGSDGKALQVGLAAAAGLHASQLARGGARVPLETVRSGPAGFEQVFGVTWPAQEEPPAVSANWIKAYPCCLATHSAIDAALAARGRGGAHGPVVVHVHPIARAAAGYDDAADGLQAKFSIPYLVAFALLRGAPRVADFADADEKVRAFAQQVEVRADPALGEMAARLELSGAGTVEIDRPSGSPGNPLSPEALREKMRDLAGDRLDSVLDDDAAPAARAVAAAGLARIAE